MLKYESEIGDICGMVKDLHRTALLMQDPLFNGSELLKTYNNKEKSKGCFSLHYLGNFRTS